MRLAHRHRRSALRLRCSPAVACADETDRYRLEKSDNGYVRMDTQTGEMSICEERSGQLVCKLAADERAAFEDEIDRLQARGDGAGRARRAAGEFARRQARIDPADRGGVREDDGLHGALLPRLHGHRQGHGEGRRAGPAPTPDAAARPERRAAPDSRDSGRRRRSCACRLKSRCHRRIIGRWSAPNKNIGGLREGHLPSGYKFVIADDHPLFRGALKQALAGMADVADHPRGRRFRNHQGARRGQ